MKTQGALLRVAVLLFAAGVTGAQATVETGWPVGTPNTPKHPDDIFLDFEGGIDGIQIESTIPSLKFTTTSGLNWQYGDVRTGAYNVNPYGTKDYETRGNFFAWLGTTGDAGRIDFLGGGATYCSVLVSTSSGVQIDAYNSENTLIATSGRAGNNLATGTVTRLTVDAPAGQAISYVIIHDTGNYWLMDDLCTDANKAVIPVPGRAIGSHGEKFDIVFVPDNDYGAAADVDTWLPTFLDHISHQLDDRLGAVNPVTGNLCKFNFYYTKMQGVASSKTLPTDLTLLAPFADAFVIVHTAVFGDSTNIGTPSIFGCEGEISAATQNGRSFIHEGGHGIFGLADEYNESPCRTAYFQPNPNPNIWATETAGRTDATGAGWNPDDINKFTDCSGDWWRLGTVNTIMVDGTFFANGWGTAGDRRVQWALDQFPACAAGEAFAAGAPAEADKSIWLNVQVDSGVFSLLDQSYITESPPNYLPQSREFIAKVFSNGGAPLGEYDVGDPRKVLAESDYTGPTFLNSTVFGLVVPYFASIGRVDLVDSSTGGLLLSVDLSQYATAHAPQMQCNSPTVATTPGLCSAEVSPQTLDNGSVDPDGDPISLSVEPPGPYARGTTDVTLTGCDPGGACGVCDATITVVDNEAPQAACQPATNPSGRRIPTAQNPDGFYQLSSTDNCDSTTTMFVADSGSTFIAGPFRPGDIVKITQSPTESPFQKPGARDVAAHIRLKGHAVLYAVDASGNTSTRVDCFLR
jgi:hypothetical protein